VFSTVKNFGTHLPKFFFRGKKGNPRGEKETQGERNLLTLVISYLLLVTRDGLVQGMVWL
jgi:hypothetical protein